MMTPPPPTQVARRGLVTIVVPAKDEGPTIGRTLRSLPRTTLDLMGFDVETIILDGHSHDETRNEAYGHGDSTVVFDRQWGKGRALINARSLFRGDYVIMLDADGTYAPDAIPRVLGPLARGQADVVMGKRLPLSGAMTGVHRIGNAMLSALAELLYVRPCPDLCTGLWGFRAEALHALPLRSYRFELEAEMFAFATRLGFRVEFVPVDYLPRSGASKLSSSDALRIGWWLLRSRVAPLQIDDAPPRPTLPEPVAQPQGAE